MLLVPTADTLRTPGHRGLPHDKGNYLLCDLLHNNVRRLHHQGLLAHDAVRLHWIYGLIARDAVRLQFVVRGVERGAGACECTFV